MSRRCDLTGVGVMTGNNVSHSQRKTRRRFLPNLQRLDIKSDALGQSVRLRITSATLRTIEHNGGLDSYLLKTSNTKLTVKGKSLKRSVVKAAAKAAAKAA